jgi:hypothetical protein
MSKPLMARIGAHYQELYANIEELVKISNGA